MSNKFPVGSMAVEKKSVRPDYSYHPGEVIAILIDGTIVWEQYGRLDRMSEDQLLTIDEAVDLETELNANRKKLDDEFEAIRDQLQGKMDQATALVQEASAMAEACQKDFGSLRNECRPLFRALEAAGWRASSMQC